MKTISLAYVSICLLEFISVEILMLKLTKSKRQIFWEKYDSKSKFEQWKLK